MNPYERMIGEINRLKFGETTSLPEGVRRYTNRFGLEWSNPLAIQRVYETTELLKREPDMLGQTKGQAAIWFHPKSKVGKGHYFKFEIWDASYQHTKPARHSDFFFVWLRMKMKPEKASNINKITSSAFYYEPGQLVCAACHFIEASIATFSVLKDYNNDRINLEQARQVYDNRIDELFKEFLKFEKDGSPTPLRDILETYIMSDNPPDEVFEMPDCGCEVRIVGEIVEEPSTVVVMESVTEKIPTPKRALRTLSDEGNFLDLEVEVVEPLKEPSITSKSERTTESLSESVSESVSYQSIPPNISLSRRNVLKSGTDVFEDRLTSITESLNDRRRRILPGLP